MQLGELIGEKEIASLESLFYTNYQKLLYLSIYIRYRSIEFSNKVEGIVLVNLYIYILWKIVEEGFVKDNIKRVFRLKKPRTHSLPQSNWLITTQLIPFLRCKNFKSHLKKDCKPTHRIEYHKLLVNILFSTVIHLVHLCG